MGPTLDALLAKLGYGYRAVRGDFGGGRCEVYRLDTGRTILDDATAADTWHWLRRQGMYDGPCEAERCWRCVRGGGDT